MKEGIIGFVYLTENLINGKRYIGAHRCGIDRIATDDYLGSGQNIKRAIKKYGTSNFKRTILYVSTTEPDLFCAEKYLINLNSAHIDKEHFYNIRSGKLDLLEHGTESDIRWLSNYNNYMSYRESLPEFRRWPNMSEVNREKAKYRLISYNTSKKKKQRNTELQTGKPLSKERVIKMSVKVKEWYENGGMNPLKGTTCYSNPITKEIRYLKPTDNIPCGFVSGNLQLVARKVYHNIKTGEIRKFDSIPSTDEWKSGKGYNTIWIHHIETKKRKRIRTTEQLPPNHEYGQGIPTRKYK